jgi:integrase
VSAAFYDFDQYERLIEVARAQEARTHLIVLPGAEAGLSVGEMMALEWGDVDLANRQLCVARSDWNGFATSPKGGRLRRVPLTRRLAAALGAQRHLRSTRVLCQADGKPLTRPFVQARMKRASRQAGLPHDGLHILRHSFCSQLAMRGAPARAIQELAGNTDLTMTQRYMPRRPASLDAAIRLLEQPNRPSRVRGSQT